MWYVYILECKNDFLYTGITNNLQKRFEKHQQKSVRFTSYNPPIEIAYSEPWPTRSAALKREAQIKKWPRTKKLALVKSKAKTLK